MQTKKLLMFLSILLLTSLVLVGCNNPQSSQPTKEDVNSKGLLQQIKKRGKVIVGTEAAFAPFEYVENGKIVGYGADILQEIVNSMGLPMEQLDVPFSSILPGLESKKFDFIATSIVVTPERKEKFALTVPIADTSDVFLKRKDDKTISSIADVNDKVVGCVSGSSSEKLLKQLDEKLKAEGKSGFKDIKFYQSNPEAYLDWI